MQQIKKIKINQFKFLLPILILSCTNNQSQKEFERLEIWEDILIAVKEKRIDYLLEISKDTLECIACNNGEDWILKETFFVNYFEQIGVLDSKEYSIYSETYEDEKGFNKRYRINYAYRGKGEKHNSIYTILEGENGIQFQGVFGVP